MAFFKSTLNVDEFYQLIDEETKSNGTTAQVNNIEILDFTLTEKNIENIHFSNTSWTNINAENKTFNNVVFQDCSFKNVNFRNSTLINVVFKNCDLKNVVLNNSTIKNLRFESSKLISTDTNVKNSYRELVADKIKFDKSELKNINFFDSKAEFYFNNSKLDDVTGMGLKSGSALYFNNVNAFDIDFSSSNLSTLEVKNSTIKNSKANGCTIGTLLLEDSKLDFPIGFGKSYETVIAKNAGSVLVAGTPTKKINISSCPKDTRVVSFGGDAFDSVEIEGCNASEIKFYRSTGRYVSIENADVYMLDFSSSNIEHLKLNNVNIRTELYYDNTNIKKLEATNISFEDGLEHTREGSNIEIKADK
ncbi:MAG: pentapeptide repeat-containing protein [Gammaproteobacteria bacterium]|nr:pentapeptide repeat-containing protein [Gammaproteobacteria bacterium]